MAKSNLNKYYMNVDIPNKDSNAGLPTEAVFSQVRDEPIFKGPPENYYMSVVRMTIPTSFIPIQYIPIRRNTTEPPPTGDSSDINYSLYSVSLEYNGNVYTRHLKWIAQENTSNFPPPSNPVWNIDNIPAFNTKTPYYSLYSYQHFANIMYNAFNSAYLDMIAIEGPITDSPPFIIYNNDTLLYSIYVKAEYLDNAAIPIKVYFNKFLWTNFEGTFDSVRESFSSSVETNVRLSCINRGNNITTLDNDTYSGNYYEQKQESTSTGLMLSFKDIIVRSNTMPMNQEVITLNANNNNESSQQLEIGDGNTPIISDFEIDLSQGYNLKSYIHYIPTAEYRRITLNGMTPIVYFNIRLFWRDNLNNVYPILIPPYVSATIKILFEEYK